MHTIQQYEKYKDSGIAWIGEIPEHLKIIRNKYYLKYIKGKIPYEINKEQKGVPYIGATNLDNITLPYENFTEDLEIPLCKKEDILILWDGARAGLLGKNHEGAISSTIVKIEVNKTIITETYFYYYLKGFEKFLFDKVNGTTIPHMNKQFIEDLYFLTFSLSEQEQIADYLDKKCALIDESIEKSKVSIEKLKEYKQAIITEAVTKGLNKSTPLKNSNIEWIGQIPEHWEIRKLKKLSTQIIDGTHNTPIYTDTGIPFLRVTDISSLSDNKDICFDNIAKISEKEHTELIKRCYPQKGDLLVSKNGSIGIPKIITWDTPCSIFVSLCLIKVNKRIFVKNLYYYFKSSLIWNEIAIHGKTGTITNLHLDKIREFLVPVPPLSEQEEIAAYLDKKCAEIDTAIQGKEKLIEKLTEYKKSLIFECVTGKRKVAIC